MKEMTHAELSREHYNLIRHNPEYRNFLHIQELELEREPCWYTEDDSESSLVAGLKERIEDLEAISASPGSVPRYYHDRIEQLQARVIHAEAKLHEHIDKSKSKKKDNI